MFSPRTVKSHIRQLDVMWPPLVAAAVGLIAALLCFLFVSAEEARHDELEFGVTANNHALIIQQGVDDYLRDVTALRALFESTDDAVTRGEFETFGNKVLEGQTAILSMSWLPRVEDGQRQAHELATVRGGIEDYHIRMVGTDGKTVIAPQRPEYFPVYYRIDVENPGRPYVYGVDQADGGIRGKALEKARDTGEISISEDLDIRSGVGNRRGILMVSPVYRQGSIHNTVEERRRDLVGFLRGVFETSAMIESILKSSATPAGLDLYLFGSETEAGAEPNLLYFHPSRLRQGPAEAVPRATLLAGQHRVNHITMGGHLFTLIAAPAPGRPSGSDWMHPWLTLAAALILTAMATAYFRASGRHARRLEAVNAELDKVLMDLNLSGDQLTTQNIRFNAALNNMLQGLVMYDAHERIVVCNERFIKMYGLSREIVKPGCSLIDLLRHMADLGHMGADVEQIRTDIVSGIERGAPAAQGRTADGREISISQVVIPQGGWVVTFEDVTERRQAEEKITRMSLYDGLTDLPNRRFFHKQIHDHLALVGREQAFSVLCLDLDHFKSVNDTLGHSAGDELLRQVADRLRGCLREADVVARLGGDEFAIFQSSVTDPAETIALMSRLIEVIAEPFDLGTNRVMIGLSIGVAMAPTDGTTPDQLLKNADMALYRAKADGRGLHRFFEPEMDARMQARRAMELDLRQALLNEEFEVLYQPLINLTTNTISAFEALLRWHHPTKGTIPPDSFVPLAEETALIVPIGEWVLNQACLEAVKWPNDVMIAVNLSPVQFKKDLVLMVTKALLNSGLPAHRLELEITESVLLFNNDATLATLHQLRALGVRISMDDFGTGYSSLSYLRSFPFDKIKIDRSFVHDLAANEDSQAIIRAVTGLGSSLKMATTGEGVETQEELDFLKEQGCTEAQGYFFSKPARADDARRLLTEQSGSGKAVA